jgi:hypothetical protein
MKWIRIVTLAVIIGFAGVLSGCGATAPSQQEWYDDSHLDDNS